MRTLHGRRTAELPPLSAGEDLVALNATVAGRLIAVSEYCGRRNRLRDVRVRIHLHDAGHGWRQVSLSGVTIAPSRVDLLPGGEFLLVQPRCIRQRHETAHDNAQVFDTSGQPVRSFRLGDGISHLAVDEPGTIWVGYFDEGVYGGDPLSAAGVARFDEYGRRLWSYWPPPGVEHIADCYALNVDARTTWACYYTGFPLVRITDTEVRPFRPGPVRGARAVLVYDDETVFIGEYGNPYRLTECRLLDHTIVGHDPVVLTDPTGLPLEKFHLVSTRGSHLTVRTARHIFEADLADHAPTDRPAGPQWLDSDQQETKVRPRTADSHRANLLPEVVDPLR